MTKQEAEARRFTLTGRRISCDQCAAMVINNTPCHEAGCPNEMHECKGCYSLVPRGVKYCEECM